jgi:hypothetical protein
VAAGDKVDTVFRPSTHGRQKTTPGQGEELAKWWWFMFEYAILSVSSSSATTPSVRLLSGDLRRHQQPEGMIGSDETEANSINLGKYP